MGDNILIIDPIFRGSRLVDSFYAAAGLQARGRVVHLLTRRDADIPHYRELYQAVEHQLHPAVPIPPDVWFRKLNPAEIEATFREIERLNEAHHFEAIFFSGWNEFFPRIVRGGHGGVLSRIPALAIDYDPAFWLRSASGAGLNARAKAAAKRTVTRLALARYSKLKLAVFDERVLDASLSSLPASLKSRTVFLSDPAPLLKPVPEPHEGAVRFLVVGLQTERKGLIDVIELLEQDLLPPGAGVHFVGRLAPETEGLRERLNCLSSKSFTWDEGFFSEERINQFYAAADYVLLPYSVTFHCSSGVLATACSHGRPVISTDHGVIGYRVNKHGLGLCYPSRDVRGFGKILESAPDRSSENYAGLVARCREYADANSVSVFQSQLAEAMGWRTRRPPDDELIEGWRRFGSTPSLSARQGSFMFGNCQRG